MLSLGVVLVLSLFYPTATEGTYVSFLNQFIYLFRYNRDRGATLKLIGLTRDLK